MDDRRAKDLAKIEPPGSIAKVVQFAEQLSFGQDALFAGTELATVRVSPAAFSKAIFERPYSMFPGAAGEGIDTLMSRYTLRTRDIQDFTSWLMRWEDARSQLVVYESPEKVFLRHATQAQIEALQEEPEIQRIVREGRRRRRVVEEVQEDTEVVEIRSTRGPKRTRTVVDETKADNEPTPRAKTDYWAERSEGGAVRSPSYPARELAEKPVDWKLAIGNVNRNIGFANVGMGSLSSGLIRGRADAFDTLQAQSAADEAGRSSAVSPFISQPAVFFDHYPPPEVIVRQTPIGEPIRVTTDWDGAPKRGADYVLVPRQDAMDRGFEPSPIPPREAPQSLKGTLPNTPGLRGVAAHSFAGNLALRALGIAPGLLMGALGLPGMAAAASMPAGSMPRQDILSRGFVDQVAGQTMLHSGPPAEAAVRTQIPTNPLMGQITLVSPPMRVASEQAERAGSAVSFDVRSLAGGAAVLDAPRLALLKNSLPPGAQAIYPALPPGSLGPQAANFKLAPSLLQQILSDGYGAQAGAMVGSIAASVPSGASAVPLAASLVPTIKRPTDAAAGVLGQGMAGPGALAHAGGAASTRGGALDYLGMPVRLAPSLAGDAQVKHAAEARKVMPAGAAAIVRPNEFTAMRAKVFPDIGAIQAEPDKSAWRHAAPSFGLRDAEPHTLLAPDSRIKPPEPNAPLPQMGEGTHSPAAKALHGATLVAPAATATLGSKTVGGPIVERSMPAAHPAPHLNLNFPSRPSSLGAGLGDVHFSTPSAPAATPHPGLAARPSLPSSPAPSRLHLPAASAAVQGSTRVASRYSPTQAGIGGWSSGGLHEAPPNAHHAGPIHEHGSTPSAPDHPIAMAHVGSAKSPKMPEVKPTGHVAIPPMPKSAHTPSLARPATPSTTTAARSGLASVSGPSTTHATHAHAPAMSMPTMQPRTGNTLVGRAPSMPIATSVPAGSSANGPMVQKAKTGGVVLPHASEHGDSNENSTSTPKALDPGAAAHEVDVLANEVWALLKHKLRFEAERLGRRH